MSTLLGQKILYAFDDEHYGWYIGTVVASLDGKAACELSKHLYGTDKWWVLLKKKT